MRSLVYDLLWLIDRASDHPMGCCSAHACAARKRVPLDHEATQEIGSMSESIQPTKTLDVRGENCPYPLIKARQEVLTLNAGEILKVVATDRNSLGDIQGWAKAAKAVRLLRQDTETDEQGREVYIHYLARQA
jgi:tRNA 2-thiouridine synthesizing protein A